MIFRNYSMIRTRRAALAQGDAGFPRRTRPNNKLKRDSDSNPKLSRFSGGGDKDQSFAAAGARAAGEICTGADATGSCFGGTGFFAAAAGLGD